MLTYNVNPGVFDDSRITGKDVKVYIKALKVLKKAADEEHDGACYQFGHAVWRCKHPNAISAIVVEFGDANLGPGEYFSVGKNSMQLDFRRALAQKYLLLAKGDFAQIAQHDLNQITAYATEQKKLGEQQNLITLDDLHLYQPK